MLKFRLLRILASYCERLLSVGRKGYSYSALTTRDEGIVCFPLDNPAILRDLSMPVQLSSQQEDYWKASLFLPERMFSWRVVLTSKMGLSSFMVWFFVLKAVLICRFFFSLWLSQTQS